VGIGLEGRVGEKTLFIPEMYTQIFCSHMFAWGRVLESWVILHYFFILEAEVDEA